MPLDRRARRLLDMLAASGGGGAPETPAARRAALEALADMADDAGVAGVSSRDAAAPGPAGPIPLRIHSPDGADGALPALVFFHGGGWVAGSLATHAGFCRRLAAASGVRVIAVDYRLAPEHRFPAALDDALAATRHVVARAPDLGVDAARIAAGGDSVGGGLAAAVAAELGADQLALQLLVCPILDVTGRSGSRDTFAEGHFISRAAFARDLADYLPPDSDPADPRVSPLRATNLAGVPAALIHTAEFDPFRDEGEVYAEALRVAGVAAEVTRHEGMIHYFYAMSRAIPYASEAIDQMGRTLQAALGR
jgi:acetyl esterase/lipase